MKQYTEQEMRQIIKDAGIRLLESGLVQGTWGNISMRIDENTMMVTPSGIDYYALKPEQMAVVDINTLEWTGPNKPTSERKLHAAIMRSRPDINAVIHSHPTQCCIIAAARAELPVMNDEMKKYVKGDARAAAYAPPGTKKMTKTTMDALEGRNACFMSNHGVIACGESIEDAFETCRVMEECSKAFIEKSVLAKTGEKEYTPEVAHRLFKAIYSK